MRDIEGEVRHDQLVDPAAATADVDSASVDLKDYSFAAFYVLVGATGDTLDASNDINLEIEESDDDSSFSDAADADITNAVTGANTGTFAHIDAGAEDDALYMTQYKGSKRYVRVVINVTGTHTNGTPIGVLGVRFGAERVPVTQP